MADFGLALDFMLSHEGGRRGHPSDPGGETCYGLSRRSYPDLDFDTLTKEQAAWIYKRDIWRPAALDVLSENVAVKVFDMAVNMGTRPAIRRLQRALNYLDALEEPLRLDGILGRLTAHAEKKQTKTKGGEADLMLALKGYHFDHYRRLVESDDTHYDVFARGWLRRAFDG